MRPKMLNGAYVPYEKPEDELIRQAHGEAPDCWVAIYALGFVNSSKVTDFFEEQFSSNDGARRRAAAEAVRFQNPNSNLSERLLALLKDSSPAVQRSACESLSEMKIDKAIQPICNLLTNEDPETRQTALRSLAILWSESNWPVVFSMAKNDKNLEVRKAASRTLRQHANVSNWFELFELWSQDNLSEHRTWACEILGNFGCAKDSELLTPLCADNNGHVRKAAMTAKNKLAVK